MIEVTQRRRALAGKGPPTGQADGHQRWPAPSADTAVQATPFISVIVVNWNGRAYLENCLAALRRQTHTAHEVILVDNGSTDDSVSLVRQQFPEVILVQSPSNRGFVGGNALGLRVARGNWIALLNNDTIASPCWLEALVAAARQEGVAGATGKVYALDEPARVAFTLPLIDRLTGRARWTNEEYGISDVHYLAGNNLVVKRQVIETVGFLDDQYEAYYEETDWCARLIRAGYRLVYTPHATIKHKELGSTGLERNRYLMERNRLRFVIKNFDWPYLALFVPLYCIDIARRLWRGRDEAGVELRQIIPRVILWNVLRLPETLEARWRDLRRLPRCRSYNRSLPRYPRYRRSHYAARVDKVHGTRQLRAG